MANNEQCTYFLTTLHVHPEWLNKKNDRTCTEQVPNMHRTSTGQDRQEDGETTTEVPWKYHGSAETEHVVNKYWTSGEQVSENVATLIKTMEGEMTRNALQEMIKIKSRRYFIEQFLNPALDLDYVEMTIPENPNSSKQRYRLTEKGKALKKALKKKPIDHVNSRPKRNQNPGKS